MLSLFLWLGLWICFKEFTNGSTLTEELHCCRRLSFHEGVVERADSDGSDLLRRTRPPRGIAISFSVKSSSAVNTSDSITLELEMSLLDLGGLQVDGDLVISSSEVVSTEVDGVEMAVHLGQGLDLDVVSLNRLLVQDRTKSSSVDEVDNLLAVERVLRHLNAFLTQFGH